MNLHHHYDLAVIGAGLLYDAVFFAAAGGPISAWLITFARFYLGFSFAKADWDEFIRSDAESLSSQDKQSAHFDNTNHWSWAFRQVSSWRAMLMEGADQGSS